MGGHRGLGYALSPLILQQLGVARSEFEPLQHAIMVERDVLKARALVTQRMLQIGVVGTSTTADLIPRLESLVASGAEHLSFGPPLGPDPGQAIRLLGQGVLRHFRR